MHRSWNGLVILSLLLGGCGASPSALSPSSTTSMVASGADTTQTKLKAYATAWMRCNFDALDKERDQMLSFAEVLGTRSSFDQQDTSPKDDRLSFDEYLHPEIIEEEVTQSLETGQVIVSELDIDRDNRVSLEEFLEGNARHFNVYRTPQVVSPNEVIKEQAFMRHAGSDLKLTQYESALVAGYVRSLGYSYGFHPFKKGIDD